MVRGEIRTIESICYYFALSQNAQETVWNNIRSEVIEMWVSGYGISTPAYIAMHSRQQAWCILIWLDGVPFLGMPQA